MQFFSELDPAQLHDIDPDINFQRELDKVKHSVFFNRNGAFLGSLMSSMHFIWTDSIPTAATNGTTFWWNPRFFLYCPFETRKTVLLHELWHAGLLHMVRQGDRDSRIWNIACDYRINNGLSKDGYTFEKVENCCLDVQKYGYEAEEYIYNKLVKEQQQRQENVWGSAAAQAGANQSEDQSSHANSSNKESVPEIDDIGDMVPSDKGTNAQAVANVVKAVHQAQKAGQAGNLPGGLTDMVDKFLKPVAPWDDLFRLWMRDLADSSYSYRRPNRRHLYRGDYLKSRQVDESRLEHLLFVQDVSGSMTKEEIIRNSSEIKYVWDEMRPRALTMIQFDTKIQQIDEFEEGDSFDYVKIRGRGGTDLELVRQEIIKREPTAIVIFSDMLVEPMKPIPGDPPILWITTTANPPKPTSGQVIKI